MIIEFEKYVNCKVYIGQDLIMMSEEPVALDNTKKRITFPEIHIKNCLHSGYLGEDFTIELWESDVADEPSVYFYDSGIMNFGMINLQEIDGERIVTISNMEFEYAWFNDIKERFPIEK